MSFGNVISMWNLLNIFSSTWKVGGDDVYSIRKHLRMYGWTIFTHRILYLWLKWRHSFYNLSFLRQNNSSSSKLFLLFYFLLSNFFISIYFEFKKCKTIVLMHDSAFKNFWLLFNKINFWRSNKPTNHFVDILTDLFY